MQVLLLVVGKPERCLTDNLGRRVHTRVELLVALWRSSTQVYDGVPGRKRAVSCDFARFVLCWRLALWRCTVVRKCRYEYLYEGTRVPPRDRSAMAVRA